jgi:hypothetical protein
VGNSVPMPARLKIRNGRLFLLLVNIQKSTPLFPVDLRCGFFYSDCNIAGSYSFLHFAAPIFFISFKTPPEEPHGKQS